MNINIIQAVSKISITRLSIYKIIYILLLSSILTGCSNHTPTLNKLQLGQLQTKIFNEDKLSVFSAVVSVLQDESLVIKSLDKDIGIISAEGAIKDEGIDLFTFSGGIKSSKINLMASIRTVNTHKTKLRLSITKVMTGKTIFGGGSSSEFIVEDSKIYKSLFQQIQKTLFLQQNTEK